MKILILSAFQNELATFGKTINTTELLIGIKGKRRCLQGILDTHE